MHRLLELDLVRVVEQAAIEAARFMGKGDTHAADKAATTSMRSTLNQLDVSGTIVIGEGERDEAPMLYIGEKVGKGDTNQMEVDIAVDPLEGTNLLAEGRNNAITVMAVAEKGGLLHAPDIYMKKLVVAPAAADVVDINASVSDNLQALAAALDLSVEELVIVVLERERHTELIQQIRETGARIQLISDGDILPALSATMGGTNVHALMGVGAAPEGVLAAAALKCLQGTMQAQFVVRNTHNDAQRLADAGITDPQRIFTIDDLAPGKHILFAATAVTPGDLLNGIEFTSSGVSTQSLVMSLQDGTIRCIDSTHLID